MKTRLLSLLLLLLVFTLSCDDDSEGEFNVNLDKFEAITEQYPYTNLAPADNPEYWELDLLRQEGVLVLTSSGTKCLGAEDQEECLSEFESVTNDLYGFASACDPGQCLFFMKYQKNGATSLIISQTQLRDFLGEIDSPADAILLAFANGYRFNYTKKKAGAIRETSSGYELIVTKLVKICTPIQVDRYLLKVGRDGSLKVLQVDKKYEYYKNGCV